MNEKTQVPLQTLTPKEQPWQGLLSYDEKDKDRFFGRETETNELFRLVRRKVLTVLFGRSGMGKSSLLKAGLFPALREKHFLPVWIRLDHSGVSSYDEQIRQELESAVRQAELEQVNLHDPLAGGDDGIWEFLHRTEFWNLKNQPVSPVLVFDQFEEIFTLGEMDSSVDVILEDLADLVENYVPQVVREVVESDKARLPTGYHEQHYKVIITLREEFVSRLDGMRDKIPSVMHNRFSLGGMDGNAAYEAVLKPGCGIVDPGVAEEIVKFVAAANGGEIKKIESERVLGNLIVEPAMLSLVCSELNLQRIRDDREQIVHAQVRTSSAKILEGFYERSLRGEGLDHADRVFIEERLLTASGFRTTVPVEEAVKSDLTMREIGVLEDRRLIRKENRLGIPHIELTHDVLTQVVKRSRDRRREVESLESDRLKKEKLAEERTQHAKGQLVKKLWWASSIVAIALAALANRAWKSAKEAGVARTLAVEAREEADTARSSSDARALALNAVDASRNDPELAILLSIEAALLENLNKKNTNTLTREAELALRSSTRKSLVRMRYEGSSSKVYSVDFDPQGQRLLTGSYYKDSKARIWDVKTGRNLAILDHSKITGFENQKMTISCARFSPDGRKVVTGTYLDEGYIFVWDVSDLATTESGKIKVVTETPRMFREHERWVTSLAFRSDGVVASGGYDNQIRIWDSMTLSEVHGPLKGHADRIRSLVFSRDDRQLLSASDDGTAILWNLENKEDEGRSVAIFSSDLNVDGENPSESHPLSAGTMSHKIFDAFEDGRQRETLHSADLSPSGHLVATGGNDRFLRVWDTRTCRQLTARGHSDAVMSVAFIDDSRLVSVCNDATIRFWALDSAVEDEKSSSKSDLNVPLVLRLIESQRGHAGWIRDVAVSPGGQMIATASDDGTARSWALPPGGEAAVVGGDGRNYWSADLLVRKALSEENEQLIAFVGSADGSVQAIDALKQLPLEKWGANAPNESHTKSVRAISVSPDGSRLVSASGDQTVIVRDSVTGEYHSQWIGHKGKDGGTVYHARFSPDGESVVSASNDGTAQVWRPDRKGRNLDLILVPSSGIYRKADIVDARGLAENWKAGASPVSVYFWERLSEDEREALERALGLSEWAKGMTIKITEIIRGTLNRVIGGQLLENEFAFQEVSRSKKSEWASIRAVDSRAVVIANRFLVDDTFPELLRHNRPGVYDARYSFDGSKIVTADFGMMTATVWDARDGKRLRVFPGGRSLEQGHTENVTSASFSPDGAQVVTACMDGYCRIWDMETGALVESIPHKVAVRSAAFSPDGGLLLTTAADGVARLWTVPLYYLRSELRGHTETIPEASFSKNGRYIITASRDGTARIFYTDSWDVYALANRRVTRKLTEKERKEFGVTRELTEEEIGHYRKQEEKRIFSK